MARRPFDPGPEGLGKVAYRRGDILDRGSLAALFDGADVAVHLAFAIFGSREQTRRVNLEGSRNVFEAAVAAGVKRLVYASSVAAYGFLPDNPQPLTEEVPVRGSEGFYYSAQKAELEATLSEIVAASEVDAYVFRPCVVAGPRATMLIEQVVKSARLGDPLPALRRGLGRLPLVRPILPDAGIPIQLVHHDDVAQGTGRSDRRCGPPGRLQPRRQGRGRGRRDRRGDRLALGSGAEPGRRRRGGLRQAAQLRLTAAGVGRGLCHAGPDGCREGAPRTRLGPALRRPGDADPDRDLGPRNRPARLVSRVRNFAPTSSGSGD